MPIPEIFSNMSVGICPNTWEDFEITIVNTPVSDTHPSPSNIAIMFEALV